MVEASKFQQSSEFKKDIGKDLSTQQKPDVATKSTGIISGKELQGNHFCFTGTFSKPRHTLEKLVKDHGGFAVHQVTPGTHFLVSTIDSYDRKSKKLQAALGFHVPIVKEDFVFDAINAGGIDKLNLNDYIVILDISDEELKHRTKPKTRKPDPDYETKARIEQDGLDNYYDILLRNYKENKECRMQILHDHGEYRLFIKYRTMMHGGATKYIHSFKNREGAIEEFESKFLRKTGNQWNDYLEGKFSRFEDSYDLDEDYKIINPIV
jgi:hypothetical protein